MGLLTSRKNLIAARDTLVAPKKLVYAKLSDEAQRVLITHTYLKHRLAI